MMRPFVVCVEGNAGVGKTTMLKDLEIASGDRYYTVQEAMEEWKNLDGHNLLELSFSDSNRHAFTFQNYVMMTMFDHHRIQTKTQPILVVERSVFSCLNVFARRWHELGAIDDAQFAVMNAMLERIREFAHCDLMVYLRMEPEANRERLIKREKSLGRTLLIEHDHTMAWHNLHEDWIMKQKFGSLPAECVVIDAESAEPLHKQIVKIIKPRYENWIHETMITFDFD